MIDTLRVRSLRRPGSLWLGNELIDDYGKTLRSVRIPAAAVEDLILASTVPARDKYETC